MRQSLKNEVLKTCKDWFPNLLPLVLLIGKIAVGWKFGKYNVNMFPSDLCYYGVTFYVWALTTTFNGQAVSLTRFSEGESHIVVLLLTINFFLYVLVYPIESSWSSFRFVASIVLAGTFGIISPLWIRSRL
jgi:hypothetical protein